MIQFNIINGLNDLVNGAKFKGLIKYHTQEEYNNIEQLDFRPKPTWFEVYDSSLNNMRQLLKEQINNKTDELIEYGFFYNDGEVTHLIHLGIEEQINLDTMDRLRDELHNIGAIVFPYKLKVSDNEYGEGNYITLQNADHFHEFFLKGVIHKNLSIYNGRILKDSLSSLNREQLENFRDNR